MLIKKFLYLQALGLKKRWHILYGRFVKLEEEEFPDLNKNDEIKVKELILHDKETKAPSRYTEASLIKELEQKKSWY